MDKSDVLYKSPLAQVNWDNVKATAGEQKVTGVKDAKALVEAAKKDNTLKKPYVKVGVVKSKLVFRIKHDDGHYGNEDIVLVKNFSVSTQSVERTNQLALTGGNDVMTPEWWTTTLHQQQDTEQIATKMQTYQRAAQGAKTHSLANYRTVMQAIEALEQAADQAGKRFKHKLDQPLIKKLQASIANSRSAYEEKLSRYRKGLESTVGEITSATKTQWEEPLEKISDFYQKCLNSNVFTEAQTALRQSQQQLNHLLRATSDKGLKELLKVALERHDISVLDIDTVSLRQKMGEARKEAVKLSSQFATVENHVDQLANQIDDVDNLSTDTSPNYLRDLKRVIAGYKQIVTVCTNELQASQQLAGQATQLLQAAQNSSRPINDVMNDALALAQDFKDCSDRMDQALARARQKTDELPALRKQLGISEVDDSKLIKPHWWTATMLNRKAKDNLNAGEETLEELAEANKQHQSYANLKQALK